MFKICYSNSPLFNRVYLSENKLKNKVLVLCNTGMPRGNSCSTKNSKDHDLAEKPKKPVSLLGLGNPNSARFWRYQLKKAHKFGSTDQVQETVDEIPSYLKLLYDKSPEEIEKKYPDVFNVLEASKDDQKKEEYKKAMKESLDKETPYFPFQAQQTQREISESVTNYQTSASSSVIALEQSVSKFMKSIKKEIVGKTTDTEEEEEIDLESEIWRVNYGSANPDIKPSNIPCGGCGALLHCTDSSVSGYMPSERFVHLSNQELRSEICQRCLFFHHYNIALNVSVPKDDYPKLLSVIKNHPKALIVLVIDLTDYPCSIWPGILELVGKDKPFFVIGNKVDLLPQDSKGYLERIVQNLENTLKDLGICKGKNLKHSCLISAKTGYGVEYLITKMQRYGFQRDIFLIGCTNVGKSTLFNALMQSDFCKVEAVDIVQRATTSVWPGTTLNLLKFPILKATAKHMYLRQHRLKELRNNEKQESMLRKSIYKTTRDSSYATLIGRIGMTFKDPQDSLEKSQKAFDPERVEFKYGYFCFDTPGAVYNDQILDLLTVEELNKVLPKKIIHPRTFALRNNQTLFLAGLARVEVEELIGAFSLYITIFASNHLPVHIVPKEDADLFYQQNLGTSLLGVPLGGEERLKLFPPLASKKFSFEGNGPETSNGDVVLSSAGWIAITMRHKTTCILNVSTPDGRGLHLRKPALLPNSVMFKGKRINDTPAFENKYCSYLSA